MAKQYKPEEVTSGTITLLEDYEIPGEGVTLRTGKTVEVVVELARQLVVSGKAVPGAPKIPAALMGAETAADKQPKKETK